MKLAFVIGFMWAFSFMWFLFFFTTIAQYSIIQFIPCGILSVLCMFLSAVRYDSIFGD